jgi:hypothetical protein
MEFLIGNIIGALIGLVIGVVLEVPLTRFRDNVLRRVRRFRAKIPIPPIPFQFAFGPIDVPFVIVDGDGQAEYTPATIVCHYDPTPVDLPPEIEDIKAKITIQEEEKRRLGESYMWNGPVYALKRYTRGRTADEENLELNLWFGPSDWFTFLATNMSLDSERVLDPVTQQHLTLREKYFGSYDWSNPSLQPVPFFSNTFGVVVSLISGDRRLIVVRRADEIGARKGVYNIAINEGVHRPFDRSDYGDAPNLYRTVVRGAAEELSLELRQSDITFFAFGVDSEYSMWVILGIAHTNSTVQEIIDMRRRGAKDKWEGRELISVDFNIRSVLDFISNHQPWSPGALTCIYYTLVHEFGKTAVEQAIARHLH